MHQSKAFTIVHLLFDHIQFVKRGGEACDVNDINVYSEGRPLEHIVHTSFVLDNKWQVFCFMNVWDYIQCFLD